MQRDAQDEWKRAKEAGVLPPVLSIREVAEFLRVDETTIRNLIRCGRLKAVKVGRIWRILREAVLELLGHVPPPVAPAPLPDRVPPGGRPGRPRKIRRYWAGEQRS